MLNSRHGLDLPALAAQLGCRNPVAIKTHPQSITCRVEGPEGQPAILKAALGRGGKRVLKKEWSVLDQLRLDPPAAAPKVLGWQGNVLLMEAIEVPPFNAEEAKEILGSEETQQKLESLLLQLPTQTIDLFPTMWRSVLSKSPLKSIPGKAPIVFSQGDLSERNLLIDPNAESIYLIDFQEAGWRTAGYDLIHLCCHARQAVDRWGWQKKLFARVWPKLYPDANAGWAVESARKLFIQVANRQLGIDRYLSKSNPTLRPAYEEGIRARLENISLFQSKSEFNSWYGKSING